MHIPVWVTHNGRAIPINKLDDRHLGNCIRMVQRGMDYMGRTVGPKHKRLLGALLVEAEVRRITGKPTP